MGCFLRNATRLVGLQETFNKHCSDRHWSSTDRLKTLVLYFENFSGFIGDEKLILQVGNDPCRNGDSQAGEGYLLILHSYYAVVPLFHYLLIWLGIYEEIYVEIGGRRWYRGCFTISDEQEPGLTTVRNQSSFNSSCTSQPFRWVRSKSVVFIAAPQLYAIDMSLPRMLMKISAKTSMSFFFKEEEVFCR